MIMSIHQPRYSIFKTFDTLSLLSLGEFVYQGPANEAMKYFEDIGDVYSLFTAIYSVKVQFGKPRGGCTQANHCFYFRFCRIYL